MAIGILGWASMTIGAIVATMRKSRSVSFKQKTEVAYY